VTVSFSRRVLLHGVSLNGNDLSSNFIQQKADNLYRPIVLKVLSRFRGYCVTNKTGSGLDDSIYCTLYKQYSAIAVLHTFNSSLHTRILSPH
jgi:hypothetical protein